MTNDNLEWLRITKNGLEWPRITTVWLFLFATLQDDIIQKVIKIIKFWKKVLKRSWKYILWYISQRISLETFDTLNIKETIKLTWQIGKLKNLAKFDRWTVYL